MTIDSFWEKFLEKMPNYIEKILSPYQLWLTILIMTSIFLFLPEGLKTHFGILDIYKKFKDYITLAFMFSAILLIIKAFSFLYNALKNFQTVDEKDLNHEERAILCFFMRNQYQGASLNQKEPVIISLRNRNFIEIPPSPIYFIGNSDYEYLVLTKPGEKKLRSKRFQRKLLEDLDENKVLVFVNSISRDLYKTHNPQNLN